MPDLKIFTDVLTQIFASEPEIFLCVALIALGYMLKTIPAFPNRFIPMVNIVVGMIVYPMIVNTKGQASYTMRYPIVRDIIGGLIIACAAHYVHALVLKRWLDKHLPLATTPTGETKFIRKDETLTPPDK
jgi:hypothetical protein